MIPPVPPEVFANNPQFKALYTQLATEILNPHDGSTRETDKSAALLEQVEYLGSTVLTLQIPISMCFRVHFLNTRGGGDGYIIGVENI